MEKITKTRNNNISKTQAMQCLMDWLNIDKVTDKPQIAPIKIKYN